MILFALQPSLQYQFIFMGAGNVGESLADRFPRNQLLLIQGNDRRSKVKDNQLADFPYNSIGYIQFKQKIGNSDLIGQGTSILISDSILLTSSHNFVSQSSTNQNKNVMEHIPISFTILQPGKSGLKQISSKIKRFMVNKEYVRMFNQIVILKKKYFESPDKQKQQQLKEKILDLEFQSIQHDFALLELQQKFKRPRYFQLYPNLNGEPISVTVTGYQKFLNQYNLLTDSNISAQINNSVIYYDIDTVGGQSGGPVYLLQDSSKLVAIHKGGDPEKKLNFATLITFSVIQVLKMWVDEMRIPFQSFKNLLIKQSKQLMKNGDRLRKQGQFQKALSSYTTALGVTQQTYGRESVQYTKILHLLGFIYDKLGKIEQALRYYNISLTIYEKIGEGSIRQAETIYNIGGIYQKQGNLEQALKQYKKSVNIHTKIGKDSIGFADNLYNIGGVYYKQSNLNQSLQYYERALQVYQNMKKESKGWADTLYNIGLVYKNLKLDNKAGEYFSQSKKIESRIKKS